MSSSDAYKIKRLIEVSGGDKKSIRRANTRAGGHSNQLGEWLSGKSLQTGSKTRLLACFIDLGLTGLTLSIFDLNDETFDTYIADHLQAWGKAPPTPVIEPKIERPRKAVETPTEIVKLLAQFEGCYQVIRPHTVNSDRYILEPLQIGKGYPPTMNMYSHHTKPEEKFLYEGEGTVSSRYCFTLLKREHEQFADLAAYRALAFYFGPEATGDSFSGLMLRGLTDAALQLASMPFIAVRVPDPAGLRDLAPRSAKATSGSPKIWQLREDSPLLLGTATKARYPDVYDACDALFTTFHEGLERKRAGSNGERNPATEGLVLQTIKPGVLDDHLNLREDNWRDLVAHLEFG